MEGEPFGTEPAYVERIPAQQFRTRPSPRSRPPSPSNAGVLAILITATVVMLVGTIILEGRTLVEKPTSGPYDDYYRLLDRLTFAGEVFISAGVILLVILGWMVAIIRSDLAEGVRQNALIATGIILAAWLIFFVLSLT